MIPSESPQLLIASFSASASTLPVESCLRDTEQLILLLLNSNHSQTIHFLCPSKFLQQLPIKVDLSTCEGEGFLDIGCCFFSCCCSRVSGCRGGYRDIIKVSPTMVDNASKYSSNLLVGKTKTVSCRSNFLQYVSRNGNRSDPGETSYKFGHPKLKQIQSTLHHSLSTGRQ